MKVTTHVTAQGFECHAHSYALGEVVISQGRSEYQAQHAAARFLDGNPMSESVEWYDGYRGGDTEARYYSEYYGD